MSGKLKSEHEALHAGNFVDVCAALKEVKLAHKSDGKPKLEREVMQKDTGDEVSKHGLQFQIARPNEGKALNDEAVTERADIAALVALAAALEPANAEFAAIIQRLCSCVPAEASSPEL